MSYLLACRVCLASDSRMFSILNGPLQELYEQITDSQMTVDSLGVIVKQQPDEIDNVPALEINNDSLTDSEDEIPLHNIRKSIRDVKIKKKSKVKLKSKNNVNESRNRNKLLIPDAREIILTKKEQIQEMLEREKSLNYINSPFKCGLCFKGFVDIRAFENHKEKHDEVSNYY
ncbi:unnamed protein product [Diatraea saccharalis]|uniref:C2H2-type domain-containing protein n=1 Tax=Diatraea saccharalis TaxID=40085 RepID=A0A9N9WFE3_9NEOP|nr:unnamed protein product [Diatraea saccharalis]